MGYSLRAVVAKHQLFKAATVDYGEVRLVSLAFGFAMIPVTDNLFDELANRNPSPLTNLFPEIFWLSAAVAS